jgi:uncharacterized phage protein gp47/JayE
VPFSRPSLTDLINRIKAGILSRLTSDQLRRSDAEVYGKVMAGASHELHGHLQYIASQVIYDTAEGEILDRWASIWLTIQRQAAVAATGPVTFTGANGSIIPSGSVVVRSDGVEFETDAEVTIASGTATADCTALTAGAVGNTEATSVLSLSNPLTGINSDATVATGGLVGGTDQEDDASLRSRLRARIQQPPHGGADYDYVAWALEVPGVTRAWVYPNELGLGTVTVRFVRDDDTLSIIPDAGEVEDVQEYIDALRPVTAALTVVAPDPVELDFNIAVTPNTQAVKDAVQAELLDLLRREAEPNGTILISRIREAISIAAGEENYTMSAPTADVTHTVNEIAVMGTITWS